MIKFTQTLLFLAFLFMANFAQGQCVPTVGITGATGDFINSFTFGTLSNPNSGDNPADYQLYLQTGTYTQGLTYTFTMQVGTPFGQWLGFWIDYNGDNLFTGANEFVYFSSTTIGSGATATGSITIPVTALAGTRRLRICAMYSGGPILSTQSCGISSFGEYEDYNITIASNTPCSGAPTAGTATASATNPCPGTTVNFNLTGSSNLGNLGYQWITSPTGSAPWTVIPGANSNAYATVTANTQCFRCIVTCLNTGQFDTSTSVCVTTQPWSATGNCWCVPTYANGGGGDNITNVTLGTLTNNTAAAGNPSPYWVDYTGAQTSGSLQVPTLYVGLASNAQITYGTDPTQYGAIWIDFNHDGAFGVNEYFSPNTNAGASGMHNIVITPPVSAVSGVTRMRIRGGDDAQMTSAQPCGPTNSTWGETEDYLVNIIPASQYDPSITSITAPGGNCFTATETVTAQLCNYGSSTINLLINPVNVTLNVNGPNGLVQYTTTASTGTLNPYGASCVTVTFNNVNMFDGGSYLLNTSLTIPSLANGNGSLVNDSLNTPVLRLNYRPTAGPDYQMCQYDIIPFGQGLTVSGCATPVNDSLTITFTLAAGQPPMCSPTATQATGSCLFASAALPALPPGASFTQPGNLTVTNLYTPPTCGGCVWAQEQRFSLFQGTAPPAFTNIFVPGAMGATGTSIPTGYTYTNSITQTQLGNIYSALGAGGTLNLGNWNIFSANQPPATSMNCNANGNPTVATLKIYYQYVPASFEWYNVPVGGTNLYSFSPFNPLITAGSGLTNSNTPGTSTFYASCVGSSACRVPVDLVINPVPGAVQDTLAACEPVAGTNYAIFDLNTLNASVSNNNPNTTVQYYGDQGLFSQIINTSNDTSSTNFIYSKVIIGATGCYSTDSVLLQVNNVPEFTASLLSGNACAPSSIDVASLINQFSTVPSGTDTLYFEDPGFTIPHPNPHAISTVDTVYMVFVTNTIPACSDTAVAYIDIAPATNNIANQDVQFNYSVCGTAGCNNFTLLDGQMDTLRSSTDCKKVAAILDVVDGTDLGSISVCEEIDCITQFHNGQPYVNRVYNIVPTNNDSAMVCLYYLDDDFQQFNASAVPIWPALPTALSPGNAVNLAITKVDNGDIFTPGHIATAIPNSMITSSYDPATTVWTVCFPVSGFSYFYAHSQNPLNIPLPVSLLSFTGNRVESTSLLKWSTSSEQNNSHFIVERSRDGKSFSELSAAIPSKGINGNSSTQLDYTYTDLTPNNGHNYYRLQQNDLDGQKTYSPVVDVYFGNESLVTLYPNPVNTELHVDIQIDKSTIANLKIMDAAGRVVRAVDMQLQAGANQTLVSLQGLSDGVYMIRITNEKGLNYSQTIRKN
ncbi:MAG: T9SS type A sorting domain-containing protein [Chitinophagaceae bacterium]|nr:T9SS type A sorting domain-containing protein [Chitinophagaceae bacterium]